MVQHETQEVVSISIYLLLLAACTLVILKCPLAAPSGLPGIDNPVKDESELIASHLGSCRCVRKRGRTYWWKEKKRASFISFYSKGRAELFQCCGYFIFFAVGWLVVVVITI